MLLSVSFFSIVKDYVGILLSICLPVIVLSAGLVVWLHYRQKKRKAALAALDSSKYSATFPLSVTAPADEVSLSPLAQEDKIGLVKECRKQLSRSKAKYLALKHDFNATQKNIAQSENESPANFDHMENLNEKIAVYEKQIQDLQNKLEVLETVIPVQDEAYFLRQALREKDDEITFLKQQSGIATSDTPRSDGFNFENLTATNDKINNEYVRKIEQLQSEKAEADRKLSEQDYIREAYTQSKLQVEFLQNQLEERIKNYNHAEQKTKELSKSLQEALAKAGEYEGKVAFLTQQSESKYHELEHLQFNSDQKDAEIHRTKEELQTRTSQVTHLENLLAEIKEQNSMLNISFTESQNSISILKEQLAREQQHIHQMEDNLLKNRQLFERIYRDLESSAAMYEQENSQQAMIKSLY
ncbi:MAG: hypothetical protein QM764_00970 [Chitinophagaceae bacterium]